MNALEVLVKECREKKEQLSQALMGAAAKDYAEYRAICGEIRGLSYAEEAIKDLAKRLENSDDN
jgi:hypothetical protein